MTTEALLHSFLTSSESLPGATSLGLSSIAESTNDQFGTGLVADGAMPPHAAAAGAQGAGAEGNTLGQGLSGSGQARFATQAAFRRAADLLQACGAARRLQQLGYAGDGAYEGALGLTRKLHYTGYVQGLMNGRGSAAAAAAAAVGHAGVSAAAASHRHSAAAAAAAQQGGGASLHTLRGVDEDGEGAGANGVLTADPSRASVSSIDSEASVQSEMAVAEEVSLMLILRLRRQTACSPSPHSCIPMHPCGLCVACCCCTRSQTCMFLLARVTPLTSSFPSTISARMYRCWLSCMSQIATQLEVALQQPCSRAAHLAVAQLSASALLAVQPDAFSYSQLGMRLVGALARAPLRHLTPETMRLSQFSWCWVSAGCEIVQYEHGVSMHMCLVLSCR
jgi:hypothetical protein